MKSLPFNFALFLLTSSLCGWMHAASAESAFPGKTWAALTPTEAGMDAAKLNAFRDLVGGRGCVVRHGRLVYSGGDIGKRADVASACKPVLAHFLFKAVEEGRTGSADEEIIRFEPRLDDLNSNLGHKDHHITWRHLANQISCYGVTEAPGAAFDYNDFNFALFFDTLFLKVYGSTWDKVEVDLPRDRSFDVEWWNPANGREAKFQARSPISGSAQRLNAPGPGDWALKLLALPTQ